MAIQSKFGWLLSGPETNKADTYNAMSQVIHAETKYDEFQETLTKFWEITKISNERDKITEVDQHFCGIIAFNHVFSKYIFKLPSKENKHNLKLHFGVKKTEQASTHPKQQASRAYLKIR